MNPMTLYERLKDFYVRLGLIIGQMVCRATCHDFVGVPPAVHEVSFALTCRRCGRWSRVDFGDDLIVACQSEIRELKIRAKACDEAEKTLEEANKKHRLVESRLRTRIETLERREKELSHG